jgi:catechol 2,3-dioxygenase-like lactoylglutathione lyase family enzyme
MDWKLEVIPVPVTDVERGKAFYADRLGFAVDLDVEIAPGRRLIQVTPPGSGCSMHLGNGNAEASAGPIRGLQLVVSDIKAARAHLVGAGVDGTSVRHFADGAWLDGHGGRWNAFVFFDDPDGNGWVIQERPATE